MKKNKPQEKLIHIKAESKAFSAFIIVPESEAVRVLEDIRDGVGEMWDADIYKKKKQLIGDKLVVNTCVHNPTLF
jgi:hypothetical protein